MLTKIISELKGKDVHEVRASGAEHAWENTPQAPIAPKAPSNSLNIFLSGLHHRAVEALPNAP